MRKTLSVFCVIVLAATFAAIAPVQPAQASMARQSDTEKDRVAEGELGKVDTTKQTFTLKTGNNLELEFRYDSNTKVEGGRSGVQGLSSETGTRVMVYYQENSGQKLATKIEIRKKED